MCFFRAYLSMLVWICVTYFLSSLFFLIMLLLIRWTFDRGKKSHWVNSTQIIIFASFIDLLSISIRVTCSICLNIRKVYSGLCVCVCVARLKSKKRTHSTHTLQSIPRAQMQLSSNGLFLNLVVCFCYCCGFNLHESCCYTLCLCDFSHFICCIEKPPLFLCLWLTFIELESVNRGQRHNGNGRYEHEWHLNNDTLTPRPLIQY